MNPGRFNFRKALLVSAMALAASPATFVMAAESASVQTATQRYNISAGSLADGLMQLASAAGVTVQFSSSITEGHDTVGLEGEYTLAQGFSVLLQGSNLEVVNQGSGVYTLREENASSVSGLSELAPATVNSSESLNGSAEVGYRSNEVTDIGVWQGRTLQETPYSINVFSEDFLKNLQATSPDQVFKLSPTVQLTSAQEQFDQPNINARGFGLFTAARNGVARDIYSHGVSMEDVATVEILTGLSGFLYGPKNVGGLINYVSKRPTQERLSSVTVGTASGSNAYIHGDFGGRLGSEGDFGYRINLVTQDGETATEHQNLKKSLASIALDWQLTDNLLIQVDGSTRDYRLNGRQPYWYLADDALIQPDAEDLDSDKLWGQKWDFTDTQTDRLGVNVSWQLNENMSLRAGYLDEEIARSWSGSEHGVYSDGTYEQSNRTRENAPQTLTDKSGFIYFDVDFETGAMEHKLNVGLRTSDSARESYRDDSGRSNIFPIQQLPLSEPTYIDEPVWSIYGVQGSFIGRTRGSDSISIGDDLRFNEQWSALIGINYSSIYSKRFDSDNEGDPVTINNDRTYEESAVTPTLSIIYQPTDAITTYASYMESLQQGNTAGDTYRGVPILNSGETLKPSINTQIEIGAKVDVGGMLLTAALFEIDRSLSDYNFLNGGQQVELVQDGRQVHRGIEFTATGKASDNLSLMGGFTFLDAQTKELKSNPQREGNTPGGVAEKMIKLYGEYNLVAVPGLVLTSSVSYTGDFYSDSANTFKIDGHTLLDLGARYQRNIADKELTLRFNISNLSDERYWVNNSYLGDGRRVAMSVNFTF